MVAEKMLRACEGKSIYFEHLFQFGNAVDVKKKPNTLQSRFASYSELPLYIITKKIEGKQSNPCEGY